MRKISKPAYYHNYCIDSNQILNNTKNHQVFITVVQIRLQQIQDGGRRLESQKKSRYYTATDWPIFAKFGSIMQKWVS